MDQLLVGRESGRPLKIWVSQGPKNKAVSRLVEELGGSVVTNPELAQYALVEQGAPDLSQVWTRLKRDNADIRVLSHRWLYDSRDSSKRLSVKGYELERKPLPPAKKGTRTPFTPLDDEALVKYLARYASTKGRLSHNLYNEVEKKLRGHTASSWRERYKKNQNRMDQAIAKYEAKVRKRRDEHKEPYTDSDEEQHPRSTLEVTGGRDFPSKPRPAAAAAAAVAQAKEAESEHVPQNRAMNTSPREAKKQAEPVSNVASTSTAPARRFRFDNIGPGEKITFSDTDASSPPRANGLTAKPAVETAEGYEETQSSQPTESLRLELESKGFGPIASRKRKRSVEAVSVAAAIPEARPVPSPIRSKIARKQVRSTRVVAQFAQEPPSPVSVSPRQASRAPSAGRGAASLTSAALPASLAERDWPGHHLDTLLSEEQFDDLLYVCTGSLELAKEITTMMLEGQEDVDVHIPAVQGRIKELRRAMWKPEEDAELLRLGVGKVSSKLVKRHGQEAVRARVAFLNDAQQVERSEAERSRRRFPYDQDVS